MKTTTKRGLLLGTLALAIAPAASAHEERRKRRKRRKRRDLTPHDIKDYLRYEYGDRARGYRDWRNIDRQIESSLRRGDRFFAVFYITGSGIHFTVNTVYFDRDLNNVDREDYLEWLEHKRYR